MKIGEYEQMMAYLTRPGFNGGSGKKPTTIEELKKSGKITTADKVDRPDKAKLLQAIRDFELRNPRKNKSEGGPMVPEPKPLTEEIFKENADRFIKGALGGFPKDEMITKLQEQLDKVQESGTFSKEQAINFINERTKQLREFIKQNPGETLPELDRVNKAIGGGVIVGEDLGSREGFGAPAQIKTGKNKDKWRVTYRDPKFGRRKGQTGFNEGSDFFDKKEEADAFYKDLQSKKETKKSAALKSKYMAVKNQAEQINDFVNNFIDQNIEKYSVRDYEKFEKDLKKDFKKFGIKDVSGRKALYDNLPNIGTKESEATFTSKYESRPLIRSKTAAGNNNRNYFKNLFYSGKIATDETLQNRISNYLDYYNVDKSFRTNPNVNRKALLSKYDDTLSNLSDVMYILGDDEVGTGKFRSGIVKKFFPEKVELFNRKKSISNALYMEKLAQIEKKLTPAQLKKVLGGETSIKKFMTKQTDKLKKIFDVSNLDEGLKFNLDHAEGIAEIAKMNDKKDIMRALQNLVGTTSARNYELGWKGYSTQRKNLINLINQNVNVKDNLKELNKITKAAYPETKGKDAYKFVNNTIKPTKNFTFLYNPQNAFKQYFTEIAGTKKGLRELKTQSSKNPKLRKIIESDPKLKKLIGSKSSRGFIDPRLLGADKLAKAITLYGPAAGRIAQMGLKGSASVIPFETLFMGDMQQKGLSPKEMALDIGTLGIGTIFKDIKEKADYVKSKGLGDELQSALRKQTVAQQARPTLGGAEGMFKEPTLTDDEQRALNMYNLDAQNIIDMRRQYQSGEYEEMDKEFGYEDPIMRGGAMDGGIMRLGFKDGNEMPVVTVEDKIDEMIAFYQDYLRQGGKMKFKTFAKKYIPQNFATGGRAGFADGPDDPSKRKFIKIMGGLASIPIVGKFFKPAAKITEAAAPVIQKTFEGAPIHFINLYKKIKNLGEDVTKKSPTREKEVVTEYEDYRLTEDVATGETTIQRVKTDSDFDYYDENLAEETYMNYRPGKGQLDEADEYIEDTSYIRTSGPQKGEIYDTVEGVPDDVIADGTKSEDNFMDFELKKKNDK